MRGLTVAMICKDEESLLPEALASVDGVADEVIIGIDTRTTDRTEDVARAFGARVHSVEWSDDFSAARNIGLAKAKREWILIIDADDRLTEFGASSVRSVMRAPWRDVEGYAFVLEQQSLNGRYRKVDAGFSIRLFRSSPAIRYHNRVHEQLRRNGKPLVIGALRQGVSLVHVGYDTALYAQRRKHERNLELIRMGLAEDAHDRWLTYQLARQYHAVGDLERSQEAARRALAMPGDLLAGRPE